MPARRDIENREAAVAEHEAALAHLDLALDLNENDPWTIISAALGYAFAGDIPRATNHVRAGLTETLAGKAITTPSTTPYGCSIKYASAAAG